MIGSGQRHPRRRDHERRQPEGRRHHRIGDRNYFMALSHVGHDCQIGNDVTLSNGVQLGGHVEVGDGVIMGGLAAAQQFSRIGQYAFISGLSGVSADVIPYGMAVGLHVRLGGLNLIGLRRRKIPRSNIHALRAAFRAIFLDETAVFEIVRGGQRRNGRMFRKCRTLRNSFCPITGARLRPRGSISRCRTTPSDRSGCHCRRRRSADRDRGMCNGGREARLCCSAPGNCRRTRCPIPA